MKKIVFLSLLIQLTLCAVEQPPPSSTELLASAHAFASKLKSLACQVEFVRIENSAHKELERRAHFDMAFERPNKLSVLMKDGDDVTYAWISDGTKIYTYLAGIEKYSTHKAPAQLDEILASEEMYVVKSSLEEALLIDDLLRTDRSDNALPANAKSSGFVADETVHGRATKRLRLTRNSGIWDVWLAAGGIPLPQQIQGSWSEPASAGKEAASISFTVTFKNWRIDEALDPNIFKFDAASKAKRVGSFLKEIPPHPLLNQPAPDITLTTMDGASKPLSSHRGRDIVVLDFWAIGCMPCVGLLPKVAAVAQRYDGKGVTFYAMDEDDSPENISLFLKRLNLTLRPTIHNKNANFLAFKIDAIPQLFVIDKQGLIRAVHSVHTDDLEKQLSAQLDALLAGRELPPPPAEKE